MDIMKRFVEITNDGSTTLRIAAWDEPYHSVHGAIQESRHVFINNGLLHCDRNPIRLLEIGFGTGLNALLSMMEADSQKLAISYTGIEAYPLTDTEVEQLNYLQQLNAPAYTELYVQMHACPWEVKNSLTSFYSLVKHQCDILEYSAESQFDLVYFDAFGSGVQPELWTEAVFSRMYLALDIHGILVTYAAKGSVRRAMEAVGFKVERLPGPPGKREMLRAVKHPTMANATP